MIDMPPEPRPAYVQAIEQKLILCGLKAGSFTVKYENLFQSVHIVIDEQAGASGENIDCIMEAAGTEIVTFRDGEIQKAYDARVTEVAKPKMLADSRAALEKRGLLNDFPERSGYASDKLFADALERHCSITPGTFFAESQWGLIFKPSLGNPSKANEGRLDCLMDAISYVSAKGEEFKFDFLGNDVSSPSK